MNMKRLAAILGLAAMGVSIVCIALSGAFPAASALLQAISLTSFLLAASISLVFYFRRKQQADRTEENPSEDGGAE